MPCGVLSQGTVIEAASKPNGAADMLPENAPPPWVLTPGGTATGDDGRIAAFMAQNDELQHDLEVRACMLLGTQLSLHGRSMQAHQG